MTTLSSPKMTAHRICFFCGLALLFLSLFLIPSNSYPQTPADTRTQFPALPVIPIEGPIGPATADFVSRQFNHLDPQSPAVILRINTPGGLDLSMRQIVNTVLEAPVPVIAWVAPAGARAASAGMFILMASDVAAMASTSNTGAATPVSSNNPDSNLSQKVINDASVYMRTLADQQERNADLAVTAVTEGSSFTADEALVNGLIDVVANSLSDLTATLDGRAINKNGTTHALSLGSAVIDPRETDWRDDLLAFVAQPNVAYLLLTIGFYGIILEFYSPGIALGGILGVICLVLASYGLSLLPINYAGAGLLALGLVLLCAELLTPGIAVLGAGGLLAFLLGSLLLIDSAEPAWQISIALIGATTVSTAGLMALVLWSALRARRQPAASGIEQMIGQTAIATEDFNQTGHVLLQGERWKACSNSPVNAGETVTVVKVDGLTLHIAQDSQLAKNT